MQTNLKLQMWDIERLIPYVRNPRKNDEQVDKMCGAISEFGFKIPIIALSNGTIVDGHLRLKAARKLNIKQIPVILADDLSQNQIKAFRILANQSANWAGWDEELLRLELAELKDADFDLNLTGFEQEEIDKLLADVNLGEEPEVTGNTDEDAVPEEQEKTVSRLGDIWIMGKHRLLCGDATKEESYGLLLPENQHVALILSDPPYNVSYQGVAGKIKNDDLGKGFYDFLLAALKPMLARCDGAAYIAMSSSELDTLQKAFREAGGHWSTFIIWAKDRFTLGRSDYQRMYEPLLYGWREGSKHHWCGDRNQGDVWNIKKPLKNDVHPTMKPVELFERAIRNSSKPGDLTLDVFAGSGTTVIACEKSGRIARMMELDPKYADVIVRRWQEFTGQKATRASDGVEFDVLETS